MSTTTLGTALDARSASDNPSRNTALASTAERRARTLAPTVYCPAVEVDECIERSQARGVS